MRKLLPAIVFAVLFASLTAALSTTHVPAVGADGNGLLTVISADAVPGTGEIDLSLHSFFSVDTQQSLKSAVAAAASMAKVDAGKYDIRYRVATDAEVVDGPSGGMAFALLAYSEFSGRHLRNDLAVTGAITPDGSAGKVGGVSKKAEAAGKQGIKLFIVPLGQATAEGIDLPVVMGEKYGMQVVEAKNLSEAIAYAFTASGTQVNEPVRIEAPLVLPTLPAEPKAPALKAMAESELNEAQKLVAQLPQDSSLAKSAVNSLNTSRLLIAKGFYYSAANAIFLAKIAANARNYANYSNTALRVKYNDLVSTAAALRPTNKTTSNLEWGIATDLRLYWARGRLKDANETITGEPTGVAQDVAVAGEWLDAAIRMAATTQSMENGDAVDELRLRRVAKALMTAAENVSDLDSEASFHYDMAKAEFDDGAYGAAAFDASFALSFGTTTKRFADVPISDATKAVLNASYYSKLDSEWARYYFAHAQYNFAEWQRSSDGDSLVNSLKLQALALELDRTVKLLKNAALTDYAPDATSQQVGNGTAAGNETPKMTISITPATSTPSGFLNRDTVLILFGALALVLVLVVAFVLHMPQRSMRTEGAVELRSKLDKLDDLVVEGRLSEENYERLRAKYSARMRQLSRDLSRDEAKASTSKAKAKPQRKRA